MMRGAKAGAPEGSVKLDLAQEPLLQMQLPYRSELKTLWLSDPQLPGLAFHRFYLLLK